MNVSEKKQDTTNYASQESIKERLRNMDDKFSMQDYVYNPCNQEKLVSLLLNRDDLFLQYLTYLDNIDKSCQEYYSISLKESIFKLIDMSAKYGKEALRRNVIILDSLFKDYPLYGDIGEDGKINYDNIKKLDVVLKHRLEILKANKNKEALLKRFFTAVNEKCSLLSEKDFLELIFETSQYEFLKHKYIDNVR